MATATVRELRSQIGVVKNRIHCTLSDQTRDPRPMARAYHETVRPLQTKLNRLRDRYYHGAELIAHYQERVAYYSNLINMANEAERVRRALHLMEQLNEKGSALDEALDKLVARVTTSMLTRTCVADYRCFVRGFLGEIFEIKSLLENNGSRFLREEADLLLRIAAADRHWDLYHESRLFGHSILDESYVELDELHTALIKAESMSEVKKAEEGVAKLGALLTELNDLDGQSAQQMIDELTAALRGMAVQP